MAPVTEKQHWEAPLNEGPVFVWKVAEKLTLTLNVKDELRTSEQEDRVAGL